jgi:metal-responsive CopG/Arc/MetJ family transcriptional regulator
MKAIQILMDEPLVKELDAQAKRGKTDRSKLVRVAAARYLQELKRQEMEARHRRGYEKKPQTSDEVTPWLDIQAWPET